MKNQVTWLKSLPFVLAIRLIVLFLVRKLFRLPIAFSYSQGAEDLIISYLAQYHFSKLVPGYYVDVGCNAPIKYSNTFELYLRGWRGINIDANSNLIKECQHVRKEDICIRAAVSDVEHEVIFHKAKEHLVSTIDEERLIEWQKHFEFADEDQETLKTKTLTSILDENWKHGDAIDLLTIDVEGHDLRVLQSLDLVKYRPKIIVIEIHDLEHIKESEIYKYLISNNYRLKFFAVLSAYFVDCMERSV